jgi:two-component system, chemotaxis family, protein-glutamate methylesterase/glutaminase
MPERIKVLIVDDSALMRQMLISILERDPMIKVVGVAPHPLKARELIKKLNPDVLTLDIEMPEMNGIDFLEKIMRLRPMPVVMISSLTQAGADVTLQALEIGAVDFIGKPQLDMQESFLIKAEEVISKVKAAAHARVHAFDVHVPIRTVKDPLPLNCSNQKMIVIGASTGGVEALRTILSSLPKGMPPIFVVQHMPKQFTKTFAERLNTLCDLFVKEAEDGEVAQSGYVYIAQGETQLQVMERSGNLVCKVTEGELFGGHRPSVSVLFNSVLDIAPKNTIGVILSGMGKDGATALLSLKELGAFTIGQTQSTCVVYGMPKAAKDLGAIVEEHDLNKISSVLIDLCSKR